MRRRITLSRATLHVALDSIAAQRGPRDVVLDLRADAFGHGTVEVQAAARSHGFDRFAHDDVNMYRDAVDADVTAALYGTAPDAAPVMTVTGEVISCKRVPAGSPVSYGYTYRVASDSYLALVGLGYADGVPRSASNKAHVLLAGAQHVLAGRVAMDQFMVDLGDERVVSGDDVILWGAQPGAPSPGEWAAASGRSPLELSAGLGARFQRVWVTA
ncbi:alanine racemase [Humibacter sp. RRB41]|uniref:alanine racemase n=1 Tax=Humibacter sp. RRB41 TaxID=2919946 RepID=UPI001FA9CECA|nr:alanine racemase C-terminal domain-containing protein [Humibacter sp. RRB41]